MPLVDSHINGWFDFCFIDFTRSDFRYFPRSRDYGFLKCFSRQNSFSGRLFFTEKYIFMKILAWSLSSTAFEKITATNERRKKENLEMWTWTFVFSDFSFSQSVLLLDQRETKTERMFLLSTDAMCLRICYQMRNNSLSLTCTVFS